MLFICATLLLLPCFHALSFELSIDGEVSSVSFDQFHPLRDQAAQVLGQIPQLATMMGDCDGDEECLLGKIVETMEGTGEPAPRMSPPFPLF